jgi:hypothetical protein
MPFAAATADDELPKVVREMRKQNRKHLLGASIMVGVLCACTYYLAHKMGVAPL